MVLAGIIRFFLEYDRHSHYSLSCNLTAFQAF